MKNFVGAFILLITITLAAAKYVGVAAIGTVALTWTVVFAPMLVYLAFIVIVLVAALLFGVLSALVFGLASWYGDRSHRKSVRGQYQR